MRKGIPCSTEAAQRATVEEENESKQNSISPEYKSSWNDVDIQGDYDQFARSVAPSRLHIDHTPPKEVSSASPRLRGSDSTKPTPRKSRVKLAKLTNQQTPSSVPGTESEKNKLNSAPEMKEAVGSQPQHPESTADQEKTNSEQEIVISSLSEHLPDVEIKTEKNMDVEKVSSGEIKRCSENLEEQTNENEIPSSQKLPSLDKAKDVKRQSNPNYRSRNSNKSVNEFTPPVVTAVDFREPTITQAVKTATKNGLLVETSQGVEGRPLDGSISRLSTLLMASYLGMGYHPTPNLITSFSVKPILPPLNIRHGRVRRRRASKRNNVTSDSETQGSEKKRSNDVIASKEYETKELAPLRNAHSYRWRHDPANCTDERQHEKPTPYRLPARNSDVETIFDQIVRWRSKVRHCGKPAMYRRITSPTLGEVALKRKLTDRLPTRQTRKGQPLPSDLRPKELEQWRRSNKSRAPPTFSVKQYMKERLREAQNDGSLTSPTVIEGICDVTTSVKQRLESNPGRNEIMKMPLPDMTLRKRQPVWQRMR